MSTPATPPGASLFLAPGSRRGLSHRCCPATGSPRAKFSPLHTHTPTPTPLGTRTSAKSSASRPRAKLRTPARGRDAGEPPEDGAAGDAAAAAAAAAGRARCLPAVRGDAEQRPVAPPSRGAARCPPAALYPRRRGSLRGRPRGPANQSPPPPPGPALTSCPAP